MPKQQYIVYDIEGGSEVVEGMERRSRYYGAAAAPFRMLVALLVAPFKFGLHFGKFIAGVFGTVYRITVFKSADAVLLEEVEWDE